MKWNFYEKENTIVVEMNSSKANVHNPGFVDDFHKTLDLIDKNHPKLPVILTGKGNIFCAGIDLGFASSLFREGDQKKLWDWYKKYSGMMLRLFEYSRLTVAAINGHTFGGGVILTLCCDFRIASQGPYKFGINEVPVGIPMPSVYTEMIRFRLGSGIASETILSGETYDVLEAIRLGLIKKAVEPDHLIQTALDQAHVISPDCHTAYSHSKKMLQYPVLKFIREHSFLEEETVKSIKTADSVRAQATAFQNLQKKTKSVW